MKKMIAAVAGIVIIAGLVSYFYKDINRAVSLASLTTPDKIVNNFRSFNTIVKTNDMKKASTPYTLARGEQMQLPESFQHKGVTLNTSEFLTSTNTTGLLVLKDDKILLEDYALGDTEASRHISFSMSKSLISALVGIAISEGKIEGVSKLLTDYVPELIGSGYDGVTIKQALQMSSGVRFNEDYEDPDSDISRFGTVMALGESFDEFSASLEREKPPGSYHHYVSIDTQVLGMVLVRATGQSITKYAEEKVWQKIGTESDAYWVVDDNGMEMALGGLNATLRDYARIGRLYLNKGNWNGVQVVPEQWVADSITMDAPRLQPGDNPLSGSNWGYGYQWWIPENEDGEFMAVGIYDQFIYIYPKQNLVIVKLSSSLDFAKDNFLTGDQSVELFRAMANAVED